MEYRTAAEPASIGQKLIAEHHTHLLGVRVEFLFMAKTPKSKGKDVWGRAKKVSGLPAFLAFGPRYLPESYEDQPNDLFVIEISEEVWERLRPGGRKALIDHELSHCEVETDEEGRVGLAIVGHDVTEFEAIVKRHGLWREDLEDFVRAGAEQLPLLPEGEGAGFSREVVEAAKELHGMGAEMTVGFPSRPDVDPETGEVLEEVTR